MATINTRPRTPAHDLVYEWLGGLCKSDPSRLSQHDINALVGWIDKMAGVVRERAWDDGREAGRAESRAMLDELTRTNAALGVMMTRSRDSDECGSCDGTGTETRRGDDAEVACTECGGTLRRIERSRRLLRAVVDVCYLTGLHQSRDDAIARAEAAEPTSRADAIEWLTASPPANMREALVDRDRWKQRAETLMMQRDSARKESERHVTERDALLAAIEKVSGAIGGSRYGLTHRELAIDSILADAVNPYRDRNPVAVQESRTPPDPERAEAPPASVIREAIRSVVRPSIPDVEGCGKTQDHIAELVTRKAVDAMAGWLLDDSQQDTLHEHVEWELKEPVLVSEFTDAVASAAVDAVTADLATSACEETKR